MDPYSKIFKRSTGELLRSARRGILEETLVKKLDTCVSSLWTAKCTDAADIPYDGALCSRGANTMFGCNVPLENCGIDNDTPKYQEDISATFVNANVIEEEFFSSSLSEVEALLASRSIALESNAKKSRSPGSISPKVLNFVASKTTSCPLITENTFPLLLSNEIHFDKTGVLDIISTPLEQPPQNFQGIDTACNFSLCGNSTYCRDPKQDPSIETVFKPGEAWFSLYDGPADCEPVNITSFSKCSSEPSNEEMSFQMNGDGGFDIEDSFDEDNYFPGVENNLNYFYKGSPRFENLSAEVDLWFQVFAGTESFASSKVTSMQQKEIKGDKCEQENVTTLICPTRFEEILKDQNRSSKISKTNLSLDDKARSRLSNRCILYSQEKKSHKKQVPVFKLTKESIERITHYWEQIITRSTMKAKDFFQNDCDVEAGAIANDQRLKGNLISFLLPNYATAKDFEKFSNNEQGWIYKDTGKHKTQTFPLRWCKQKYNFYDPVVCRVKIIEGKECFKEALCPYCPLQKGMNLDNVFYKVNSSLYLHHVCNNHGVYTTGHEMPHPIICNDGDGLYFTCAQCSHSERFVLQDGDPVNNILLNYYKHMMSSHKRTKQNRSEAQKVKDEEFFNEQGKIHLYENTIFTHPPTL